MIHWLIAVDTEHMDGFTGVTFITACNSPKFIPPFIGNPVMFFEEDFTTVSDNVTCPKCILFKNKNEV